MDYQDTSKVRKFTVQVRIDMAVGAVLADAIREVRAVFQKAGHATAVVIPCDVQPLDGVCDQDGCKQPKEEQVGHRIAMCHAHAEEVRTAEKASREGQHNIIMAVKEWHSAHFDSSGEQAINFRWDADKKLNEAHRLWFVAHDNYLRMLYGPKWDRGLSGTPSPSEAA